MAEAKQITFTVENSKAVMADINTDAARVQGVLDDIMKELEL